MDTAPRKQRVVTSQRVDPTKPANIVINVRFNGLTHFCNLTGFPTSTAHGWLTSGYIPAARKGVSTHAHILKVASENDIDMDPADFVERPAEASPAPAEA